MHRWPPQRPLRTYPSKVGTSTTLQMLAYLDRLELVRLEMDAFAEAGRRTSVSA